jgi:hypothetical protein
MEMRAFSLSVEHRPANRLGQWAYVIVDQTGELADSERFFGTEGQARRAGQNAMLALQNGEAKYLRILNARKHGTPETSFDDLAEVARQFLALSLFKRAMHMDELGHGVKAEPINHGIDVLECRGEKLDDIKNERIRRSQKSAHTWKLSPQCRVRAKLSKRDQAWFDRLARSGWTGRDSSI